jgi:hypothetical protein
MFIGSSPSSLIISRLFGNQPLLENHCNKKNPFSAISILNLSTDWKAIDVDPL